MTRPVQQSSFWLQFQTCDVSTRADESAFPEKAVKIYINSRADWHRRISCTRRSTCNSNTRFSVGSAIPTNSEMAKEYNDAEAEQAFKAMDADNDGFVTIQEFTAFLKYFMGDEFVDGVQDKIQEIFNIFDEDKDGKLNLQEVKNGYLKFQ